MRLFFAILFLAVILSGCATAGAPVLISGDEIPENISYLAVGPDKFYDSMLPLLEYRTSQYLRCAYLPIETLGENPTPAKIRARIHEILKPPHGKYLLIAGDADSVPTFFVSADLGDKFGVVKLATDLYYAASGEIAENGSGDITPVLSVGRFPSDNADEIAAIAEKTISYETQSRPGLWQRKINFSACPFSDTRIVNILLEKAAKGMLAEMVGPEYDVNAVYGDPDSDYAWHPPTFEKHLSELYSSGCLAWVYAGHAGARALDYVKYEGEYYKSFDADTARALKANGFERPIMIFLSCHAGNFALECGDSLAEALIKNPSGPPAVFASSDVSSPLGNIIMAEKLVPEMLSGGPRRIGDAILKCKIAMLSPGETGGALGAISKLISGVPEEVQIRGAVIEYNLLGDPALELAIPEKLFGIYADFDNAGGPKISIRGLTNSSISGKAIVALEIPRDEMLKMQNAAGLPAEERFRVANESANNKILASITVPVENGEFRAELEIPDSTSGKLILKAFVWDKFCSDFGAIEITKP